MIIAAWAAVILTLAGCGAYAASILAGHERTARLRRAAAIRALITWTLILILAVRILRAARHPARHARYLVARAARRIPGRPHDGDKLTPGETRDFISIVRGWKTTPERTRHP
jgi:hypothetical protein